MTSPYVCYAGDFTLASAAPLHAMLQEGIVDRNVKFTPVLDGLRMPEYIDWELQPFSNFKVPCHAVHVSPFCWLSGVCKAWVGTQPLMSFRHEIVALNFLSRPADVANPIAFLLGGFGIAC